MGGHHENSVHGRTAASGTCSADWRSRWPASRAYRSQIRCSGGPDRRRSEKSTKAAAHGPESRCCQETSWNHGGRQWLNLFRKLPLARAHVGLNLDIDGWLRGIGLAQYAEIFRANDIDGELLGQLTNDDLKDIGVASLGHRKKLLKAIAALTAAPEAPSSIPVAVTEPKTHDPAERRQVTVMFSDLVGSTALSARMDPEDLRELISAYQRCVAETVHRFDGFVSRYIGDGVLVYFGYPQAHEDDAERAVRASLEVIAAMTA